MRFRKRFFTRHRWLRRYLIILLLILFLLGYTMLTIYGKTDLSFYIPVNLSDEHQYVKYTSEDVYFLNGIAYDFYSLDELNHSSRAGLKWKTFPLPNEHIPENMKIWTPDNLPSSQKRLNYVYPSSQSATGLAFVDHIYVVTTAKLTDRRANLRRMFDQYQIKNYEWRMNWQKGDCSVKENITMLRKKLNVVGLNRLISSDDRRLCPITMEHFDIWQDIAERNSSLSLILEDDAVVVSNFAEKFNRTIYTLLRTNLLKIGGLSSCSDDISSISSNQSRWYNRDPVVVIGGCINFHDDYFAYDQLDAPPMLSKHKFAGTRCTHGYLLTACSARALLKQISMQPNLRLESDFYMNVQIARSSTLQSFWLDPPIVYQGNQVHDLDGIPSFKKRTY